MKRTIILLSLATLSLAGFGQVVRKGGVETATIKTPTVQCEECKQRIESYLMREEGVQKVVADFKRKTTTVTYVIDRTTYENVKTAIANAGFDADDVTADPSAYEKLPPCCRRASDGGSAPKK